MQNLNIIIRGLLNRSEAMMKIQVTLKLLESVPPSNRAGAAHRDCVSHHPALMTLITLY